MQIVKISATTRTIVGKKVADLRANAQIPAVVYGKNEESKPLTIGYSEFERAYREAGESSLIDLEIEGRAAVKVLVQEVQSDPLSSRFTHVDFYKVTMTEKLTANIPLKYVGEAKAVKELGGTLLKNLDEVEVRCLPGDLVHEIEVDVSVLSTFEDAIIIGDLKVPAGIEIHGDVRAMVATVIAPISEDELKKLDEKPVEDVTKVAVAEKGKKEEEK